MKTVLGHLEGAAGIAGLIKACLAVQYGKVPPNLHFQTVNPSIEPFYGPLKIATGCQDWPSVAPGAPRRISVNSFGFGGTNAHAIVESYSLDSPSKVQGSTITPLTFSAKSERSLFSNLKAVTDYCDKTTDPCLEALSRTLQHRSTFNYRLSVSGSSRDDLLAKLRDGVEKKDAFDSRTATVKSGKVLGIFTGQGAQYAQMGKDLIEQSTLARQTLDLLQGSLSTLRDSPSWKIRDEVLKAAEQSQVNEALFSQTLCTAIQIIIVDHLRAAGILLDVVVGHSSGEIAAAYAAGHVSAFDAIRIAYLRGLHAKLKRDENGSPGAMLAVGMSYADAQELCAQPTFTGRLSVAASNSPSSSTISGDSDAIDQMKALLEDLKIFARRLIVDTAYHSSHMAAPASAYLEALNACGMSRRSKDSDCIWISSVFGAEMSTAGSADQKYWVENMVRPVLFSQALDTAVAQCGSFGAILEIGPHPALKSPALETIQQSSSAGSVPSYCSTFKRGQNSVAAMSATLGYIWERSIPSEVNFDAYRQAWYGRAYAQPSLDQQAPNYQWDHAYKLHREPRLSRRFLTDNNPPRDLLGTREPSDSDSNVRFRNVVSVATTPWLAGHKVQGQVVLPAMWYVAAIIAACDILKPVAECRLIEIVDFKVIKATILEDYSPTELMLQLDILESSTNETVAQVGCAAGALYGSGKLDRTLSAKVVIHAESTTSALASSTSDPKNTDMVDNETFYDHLTNAGLEYSGAFRTLQSISRTRNTSRTATTLQKSQNLLDVVPLDLALQSLLAAFLEFHDDVHSPLWVPQAIGRLFISVPTTRTTQATFAAAVTRYDHASMTGDVDVHDGESLQCQLQDVGWAPLTMMTPANDRKLFARTVREPDVVDGMPIEVPDYDDKEQELVSLCDRVLWFYYRQFKGTIARHELADAEPHFQRLMDFVDYVLPRLKEGNYSTVKPEWHGDSYEEIKSIVEAYPDSADLRLIEAVGTHLPTALRERRSMLEFMMADQRLNDYYEHGLGYKRCYHILSIIIRRIAHRYPRMKVLEVGAGTGGATQHALEALCGRFLSYTFTDVSSGFFERAQERFRDNAASQRIIYQTLDLERHPEAQGFLPSSYDLILGSLVVHATKDIGRTLGYLRSLLKPGGYLVLIEGSGETLRSGFMMSGLPGWWVGDEDRRWGPMQNPEQWQTRLLEHGFSGIEQIQKDSALPYHNLGFVFATQAIDTPVKALRRPLEQQLNEVAQITIVGQDLGRPPLRDLPALLRSHCANLVKLDGMRDIQSTTIPSGTPVLCICEYDEPTFESLDEAKLHGMQCLVSTAERVLFLTKAGNSYSSMLIGLLRSLRLEIPHLCLQLLTVHGELPDSALLAETFLRLVHHTNSPEVLWSLEPEMDVMDGSLFVPRIVLDNKRNDRLNSRRRLVTDRVNPNAAPLTITREEHRYSLTRQKMPISESGTDLAIRYSSLRPIIVDGVKAFLSLGALPDGNEVVAVTSEVCSLVDSRTLRYMTPVSSGGPHLLYSVYCEIIATSLQSLPAHSIVVHDADPTLRSAIESRSVGSLQGVQFSYSDASADGLYLSSFMSPSRIKAILDGVQVFIDCDSNNTARPLRQMPLNLMLWDVSALASCRLEDLQSSIRTCRHRNVQSTCPNVVAHEDLGLPGAQVLDWTLRSPAHIQVQPVVSTFRLFESNKTYLLAGLSGTMGRSLCEWMIGQGANNIVLTSRKPLVDQKWLEEQKATVWIRSLDVCDLDAVRDLAREIKAALPPIAGVVNGAMVLQDGAFQEMSFDAMQRCLAPKVTGTLNLDSVFDRPLDFFIMLSSIAWVVGNPGQSNYSAANGYLHGVARARRRRGLAGSTMSIGVVSGVGYLARTKGGEERKHARSRNVMTISEDELHTIFAEAIIAGHEGDPEVIAGLDGSVKGPVPEVSWLSDPRVSQLIVDKKAQSDQIEQAAAKADVVPLRQRLDAVGGAESESLILGAFCAKLERILMLNKVHPSVALTDLGVDSLLAVEIRSFFMTELKVDIPTLKILSGATVLDIASVVHRALTDSATSSAQSSPVHTPVSDEERCGPMSCTQMRMYRIYEFTKEARVNDLCFAYEIEGKVDVHRLRRAFEAVVQNHEILRTRFHGGLQEVTSSASVELEVKSGDANTEFDRINSLEFDLEAGTTMAAVLVDNVFMCSFHHIVIDVTSIEMFLGQLGRAYSGQPLTAVSKQALDFALYEQKTLAQGSWTESVAFWRDQHRGCVSLLPLLPGSSVQTRRPLQEFRLVGHREDLTTATTSTIKHACEQMKITPYHFHLSVFRILLDKLVSLDNICIGAVDAGRTSHPDFAEVFAPMFNYLPLRFQQPLRRTFSELCRDTRNTCYNAAGHAAVPFDTILSELGIELMPSTHHPLYQAQINYLPHNLAEAKIGDLVLKERNASGVNVSYDFCVSVLEYPDGGARVTFETQEYLYGRATLDWLSKAYLGIMDVCMQDRDTVVDRISIGYPET